MKLRNYTVLLLCGLLSLSTARAQIGATKDQVEARHLEPAFEFSYNLSKDGHVIFESWYCETYHSAKVVLNQIEPAYSWKRKPGSNFNWFGTALGKPPLHAMYYHFRGLPEQALGYHLMIASLADAPDKDEGGYELLDYRDKLKDLHDYYSDAPEY
jgi:hypothetical protein